MVQAHHIGRIIGWITLSMMQVCTPGYNLMDEGLSLQLKILIFRCEECSLALPEADTHIGLN